MDARFNVNINPAVPKLAELFALNTKDMVQLARHIDLEFSKQEKRLFTTEGGSGGPKWPALSDRYKKAKKRRCRFKKLMVCSGELRRSLTTTIDKGHTKSWSLKPNPQVTVGTKVKTALYHIPGNPLKNPKLPDRDVLQFNQVGADKYEKVVFDYFKNVKIARIIRGLKAGAISMGTITRRA